MHRLVARQEKRDRVSATLQPLPSTRQLQHEMHSSFGSFPSYAALLDNTADKEALQTVWRLCVGVVYSVSEGGRNGDATGIECACYNKSLAAPPLS